MLLSILIPSLYEREESFSFIYNKLLKQIEILGLQDSIEILVEKDNRKLSIGEKRNLLVERASSKYVVFVDDDDDVSDNYVNSIYNALQGNPDCVGIIGIITFNGKTPKKFYHSINYTSYFDKNNEYFRPPNHLNPIRKDLAEQFKFPTINFSEDTNFAMSLCRSGLLKIENFIEEPIYYYKYISNK
jgi:hypothetical protein